MDVLTKLHVTGLPFIHPIHPCTYCTPSIHTVHPSIHPSINGIPSVHPSIQSIHHCNLCIAYIQSIYPFHPYIQLSMQTHPIHPVQPSSPPVQSGPVLSSPSIQPVIRPSILGPICTVLKAIWRRFRFWHSAQAKQDTGAATQNTQKCKASAAPLMPLMVIRWPNSVQTLSKKCKRFGNSVVWII